MKNNFKIRVSLIVLALLLLGKDAQADNIHNSVTSSNEATVHNTVTSTTSNDLSQSVNAAGGVGQGGSASNSMNYNQLHQAPAVFMGAAMPTAMCQKPIGGFLSLFVFGGAGANASITFEECMKLETGRAFVSAGRLDLAVKMICMTQHASKLEECQ